MDSVIYLLVSRPICTVKSNHLFIGFFMGYRFNVRQRNFLSWRGRRGRPACRFRQQQHLFFVLSRSHHFIHNHETNRRRPIRSAADASAADIRMHSRMLASLRYHRLLLACELPLCARPVRHECDMKITLLMLVMHCCTHRHMIFAYRHELEPGLRALGRCFRCNHIT